MNDNTKTVKQKCLLKLGGRKHLGEERWSGALKYFDRISCACIFREDKWSANDERIEIYELKNNKANFFLSGILLRTRKYKLLLILNWMLIYALRLSNRDWLKQIEKCSPSFALCSYGDYDRSDLIYLIAKNKVKCKIVRSYKETRVGYNFLEYETLKSINNICLYDIELKHFLEKKYGTKLFENKNVLIGPDENAIPDIILNRITYQKKLSEEDGIRHIVILSYRVDSSPDRERDQGRYYYVNTIKQLIDSGLCVHLHCAQYNNIDGINMYEGLRKEYPNRFFMEKPLEMKRDSSAQQWAEACRILSRYDYGLLHNIEENSSVSEFDKINVPHRLFAYEAAHVIPIINKGNNIVLERMFNERRCGIIFDRLSDLSSVDISGIKYYSPSYEDYLYEILNM